MLKFRSIPLEKILAEVRLNVNAGCHIVILHAEDVLRYGTKGLIPDEKKTVKLFAETKKIAHNVGMSHFALASVLAKPTVIQKLSEILEIGSYEKPWTAGQTGIETGSAHLATEHLRGKAKPFSVKQWPDIVKDAYSVLADNHWVPCATLIMGLPHETADDICKTIELVDDLRIYKSLIVPLFFIPIGTLTDNKFFRLKDMTKEHWKLLAACMRHDFYWLPTLMKELMRMDKIYGPKALLLKSIGFFAKKKLEPYIRMMERGESPVVAG
jgi:radical SAM superfamily enzyme YgiQ (UPF0313 family)